MKKEQQVLIEWLKENYTEESDPIGVISFVGKQHMKSAVIQATVSLSSTEQAQVIQQFITFVLEREAE